MKRILVSLGSSLGVAFFFWWFGVEFFQRGFWPAWAGSICAAAGVFAYTWPGWRD